MSVSIKVLSVLIAGLFFTGDPKGEENMNQNDGPYVVYKDDHIEVKSIVLENGVRNIEKLTYKDRKSVAPLKIRFSNHPDWDFTVKLQPKLENEPVEFKAPDKIFAISDIEGEFEAFRNLLIANKIIDNQYNWIFGKGHMVICGDLFDRGKEVPATLWLLYKLEQDARAKGGYVHTILGNHDIMNLSGDVRYVTPKYFENAKFLNAEYMELYAPDTELGRWLRSKNLIEKIGDNLCLHAGVAPAINGLNMSLEEINKICRPNYDKAKKKDQFTDQRALVFFDGTKSSLFWYRGYFNEPKIEEKDLDETLNLYKVKRVIVGHTIIPSNVGFYYNAKVLGLDVNQHKDQHEAALYENKQWYKVNTTGSKVLL